MKLPIFIKYFYDLADFQVQLSGIIYPLIGSFTIDAFRNNLIGPSIEHTMGPFTSSTTYFSALADNFDYITSADLSHSKVDHLKKQFMWCSAILPLVNTCDDQTIY